MRYGRRTPPVVLIDNLTSKGTNMLWTIAVILVIMWLLGMVTSYTLGGLLHLLLVLALIAVLIRIIQGRNPI
jgi:asparagine N-glycosylation enzyme membrane subunit Stt3